MKPVESHTMATGSNAERDREGREKLRPAYVLALCSLMTALGTVFMLSSGVIPIMTYASPYLAALVLVPVITEFRRKWGWMTWFATAVISLLLCADKEAAFFYVFFGCYPMIKPLFDRLRHKAVRLAAKLIYAVCVLFAMYSLLLFVLKLDLGFPGTVVLDILVYVLLIIVFFGLDRGVLIMEKIYLHRLRPKLRFLK